MAEDEINNLLVRMSNLTYEEINYNKFQNFNVEIHQLYM